METLLSSIFSWKLCTILGFLVVHLVLLSTNANFIVCRHILHVILVQNMHVYSFTINCIITMYCILSLRHGSIYNGVRCLNTSERKPDVVGSLIVKNLMLWKEKNLLKTWINVHLDCRLKSILANIWKLFTISLYCFCLCDIFWVYFQNSFVKMKQKFHNSHMHEQPTYRSTSIIVVSYYILILGDNTWCCSTIYWRELTKGNCACCKKTRRTYWLVHED